MDALFSHFDLMGRNVRKWNISSVEVFLLHMKVLFAGFKYMHSYKSIVKTTLIKIYIVCFLVILAL